MQESVEFRELSILTHEIADIIADVGSSPLVSNTVKSFPKSTNTFPNTPFDLYEVNMRSSCKQKTYWAKRNWTPMS